MTDVEAPLPSGRRIAPFAAGSGRVRHRGSGCGVCSFAELHPRLVASCEERPTAGHAFQVVLATVLKLKTGSGYKVGDGARHQDFVRLGERADPGTDVHSNATEIGIALLAFTGMDPRAEGQAERTGLGTCGESTSHGTCGSIKGSEESVSGRLHLSSTKPLDLSAYRSVVPIE
jgi:hypothetical protein